MGLDLSKELWRLSAVEAREAIAAHKITAAELALSCVNRIERVEERVKAWTYFDPENVLHQARAMDERLSRGERCRELCGIPVGVKDVFNTMDMPTCMGSPIWKGFTPGNDARVIFELRYNGAVIMGKTVTAEFAVHHPGETTNPHNPAYSPGTSSSGSAAAVATSMVPLALGTQTAGSTIRPASYCGIYGLKPSFGLVPRTGILKTLDTLDHVSLFARSSGDLRLFLDVVRVKGQDYPYVHQRLEDQAAERSGPWKIGFVKTPVWSYAENYVQENLISFLKKVESLPSFRVEEVDLPSAFSEAHDVHEVIYNKALSYYFQDEYEKHSDLVSPIMKEMIERGRKISRNDYQDGLRLQNELAGQLDHFLSGFDVIFSHSTAAEAPRGLNGREKKDPCLIWTLCRVPSMNLPLFKSPGNMPFGAQVIARRYHDYLMFAFLDDLAGEGLLKEAPYPALPY